jgi:hypothetical protein
MSLKESLKATLDRITRAMSGGKDLAAIVEELLNLVQELFSQGEKARERIRYLEGELEKKKRGKKRSESDTDADGDGDGDAGKSEAKDHSSEERRKGKTPGAGDGQNKPSRRGRTSKAELRVNETCRCELDKSTLPADAQFKGLDRFIGRDIRIEEWNVEFEREVYYSPSEGKRYIAPLPEGWQGDFGPTLRTAVVTLKYDAKTSETGIVRFLGGHGVNLSSGSVSNILLNAGDFFDEEVNAIQCQGYMSQSFVQSDDTSARVMGKYWHTHVICNENFTVYCTCEGKDRMTVIDVLLRRKASERLYRYTALTGDFLEIFEVSAKQRDRLAEIVREEEDYDEAAMSALLAEQFGEKASSVAAAQRIREAMALTYFHEQDQIPFPETLITDAAPQYEHLALYHALCWIHDGRHYEKLAPLPENFREKLEDFRTRYWEYYHELADWRLLPEAQRTPGESERLEKKFDQLFSTRTGYRELDERIAKTLARKEQLLVVLERPQVPLHNNGSELGARGAARHRDVSLHSCSLRGVASMDNLSSVVATARKLGIQVARYIYDRFSGLISIEEGLVAAIAARAAPLPQET